MFYFHPLPGEMIQFDEHIFQMGWNHQLGEACFKYSFSLRTIGEPVQQRKNAGFELPAHSQSTSGAPWHQGRCLAKIQGAFLGPPKMATKKPLDVTFLKFNKHQKEWMVMVLFVV